MTVRDALLGRLGNPEVRPGHLIASMVVQEEGVVAGHDGIPAVQQRNLQRLVPPAGGDAESAGDQRADQDPGFDRNGAGSHQVIEAALRDVVMVAVERPLGDARRGCEQMQLLQRLIRNEVGEVGSVRRPLHTPSAGGQAPGCDSRRWGCPGFATRSTVGWRPRGHGEPPVALENSTASAATQLDRSGIVAALRR